MKTYPVRTALLLVFLSLLTLGHVCASELPLYSLHVRISPADHVVVGHARITVPPGQTVRLDTAGLDIQEALIDNAPADTIPPEVAAERKKKEIVIDYRVIIKADEPKSVHGGHGDIVLNSIDDDGVVLLSQWYPVPRGLCRYRLSADIPADFEAVSESDKAVVAADKTRKKISFSYPNPLTGITLVAGRYSVHEEMANGIAIRTFFFEKDQDLSQHYIDNTKRYIKLHTEMLGPFPFKSFSIVENRHQTGYSMPTYTLLGSKVLRLPFIAKTSLGHEVLHQWLGNYVYSDYETGNWAEGLTTYLADHWYRRLNGAGDEYRKKILINYANHVSPEADIALAAFRAPRDKATRAVGYGKGAMLFHMLRKKLGDERFFAGLRRFVAANRFKKASWGDIKAAFNGEGEQNLEPFFDQWLTRTAVPSFLIHNARAVFRDGRYVLSFDIIQHGEPYACDLPVCIETETSTVEKLLPVTGTLYHHEQSLPGRPEKIVIDEHYDTMRALAEDELPPVVSAFTGDKTSIVIVPDKPAEQYSAAAAFFENSGYSVKNENKIDNEDIKNSSVCILSPKNKVYRRLFASQPLPRADVAFRVFKNPLNTKKVAAVLDARESDGIERILAKLFHYGNYSLLTFSDGKNNQKSTAPAAKGIVHDCDIQAEAVVPAKTLSLDTVISRVSDKRVVFIGEAHDEYSHHLIQFEIIKKLYRLHGRLVIGMEMFQRPFQEHIDAYIRAETDEETFLKKTEYFTRWKFEYNLYRDILHFARANSIPVVGLNLDQEIIGRVSKSGIDSLSDEMRSSVPPDIDMTNRQYRKSMRKVYAYHSGKRDFENFFQSQVLWDETMAHSVEEALERYPDHQMVVLAGNGHLQYSWGIPARVKRLTGESMCVILNSAGQPIEKHLADFVLFPSPAKVPRSPRLRVLVNQKDRGLVVEKVIKGGPAETAGIMPGDVLLAVDDTPIAALSDLKIVLLGRKRGDTVRISVRRKKFFLGEKDLVLKMVL